MSKMIQVRDVPERIHNTLKARAAQQGMSLSDFIKKELEQIAEQPSLEEWLERTRQRRPIITRLSGAQLIRKLRDSR